jgi:hypothetical protein
MIYFNHSKKKKIEIILQNRTDNEWFKLIVKNVQYCFKDMNLNQIEEELSKNVQILKKKEFAGYDSLNDNEKR